MRVLIYGLSKTGTTILAAKVQASLEKYKGIEVEDVFEPKTFELAGDKLIYRNNVLVASSQKNEVVKTLFDSGVPAEEVLAHEHRFDKKIFIVRDPRDRFISETFYRWHAGHKPNPEKFFQTLRLTKFKEDNPKDLPMLFLYSQNPHAYGPKASRIKQSYAEVMDFMHKKSKDWFEIKYEDLVDGNLSALESYLGFPIVKDVSVDPKRNRVIRTKAYDNWRKWFTEDDVRYFKPVLKEYMQKNGYNHDDWQLEDVKKLPADQGSKYIEKIFSAQKTSSTNFPSIHWLKIRAAVAAKNVISHVSQSKLRYKLLPKVPPSPPYFFVHIPKTGGTSFRNALELTVGKANIVEDYAGSPNYKSSLVYRYMEKEKDLKGFALKLKGMRNGWLIGHTSIKKYEGAFSSSNIITFIRHPVERIISSYRHRVRHQGLRCSFEEFAKSPDCINFQSKKLAGDSIENLGFVGITERYEESLEYLNWKYSLKLPLFKANQAPATKEFKIPEDLYDYLCNENDLDMALYKKAMSLLDEKIFQMREAKNIEVKS